MKSLLKLTLAGFGILAFTASNLSAEEGVQADGSYELPSFSVVEVEKLPVPTETKSPVMNAGMSGASIDMKLTIDENGVPVSVDTVRPLFSLGLVNE